MKSPPTQPVFNEQNYCINITNRLRAISKDFLEASFDFSKTYFFSLNWFNHENVIFTWRGVQLNWDDFKLGKRFPVGLRRRKLRSIIELQALLLFHFNPVSKSLKCLQNLFLLNLRILIQQTLLMFTSRVSVSYFLVIFLCLSFGRRT